LTTGFKCSSVVVFVWCLNPPSRIEAGTPLSAHPEEPMLEYDTASHPFRQDLIGNAITTVHGKVPIPQDPGIGVEVGREVLERYGKPFRTP
jgi:L-alanine-DL-glutamate epimerase-like enolase superfamily enzyme